MIYSRALAVSAALFLSFSVAASNEAPDDFGDPAELKAYALAAASRLVRLPEPSFEQAQALVQPEHESLDEPARAHALVQLRKDFGFFADALTGVGSAVVGWLSAAKLRSESVESQEAYRALEHVETRALRAALAAKLVFDRDARIHAQLEAALRTASAKMIDLWEDNVMQHLAQQLADRARFDSTTGLYRREAFQEILERTLAQSKEAGREVWLLYLDLDGFKKVNDSLGHNVGDEVLREVANRLEHKLRPYDPVSRTSDDAPHDSPVETPARQGGDEFAVLLEGATRDEAQSVAKRLVAKLAESYSVMGAGDHHMIDYVGVSIGIASSDREATAQQLLADADIAMYAAKQDGRRTYVFRDEVDLIGQERGLPKIAIKKTARRAVRRRRDQTGWGLFSPANWRRAWLRRFQSLAQRANGR